MRRFDNGDETETGNRRWGENKEVEESISMDAWEDVDSVKRTSGVMEE